MHNIILVSSVELMINFNY